MQDSIFTKIINGEIPSHKIYEDDKVFAFLDIYPVQPGHVLIVPKMQVEFVWDLDGQDYQALMAAAKKIALRLRQTMEVPFVSSRIVGVDVPHAHIHLIPFSDAAQLDNRPTQASEPDHVALATLAQTLAV